MTERVSILRSDYEALLRAVLPRGAVVHHSNGNAGNRGGAEARTQGAILKGLGVTAGFPDLTILSERPGGGTPSG